MFSFPRTTTAKQLQQDYRSIFDLAKKTKEPIVVMRNNKPDVAIIDVKKLEEMEAVNDVLESREEARRGKVKFLRSLRDLR
ncbi:MAG: type II toxin-antitoxin system Phd/YefM family antitoxin [Candidatus Levybacteria bacterium]|nr:type II toxin-antitoxin system Phd/YefM family antitoxin [Candidatus Levybacteria bacterium]